MQRRAIALTFSLGLVLLFVCSTATAQYQLTKLVSNQVGVALQPPDPLLVNAWGMVHAPGSPWWIGDNGSGWSNPLQCRWSQAGFGGRDSNREQRGRWFADGRCFQRVTRIPS